MGKAILKKISLLISLESLLCGCFYDGQDNNSLSIDEVSIIPFEEIFNQPLDKYYVLIYSPTCPACLSTIDVIYYWKRKDDFNIYFVHFNGNINIGEDVNISKTDYNDIKITTVPYLFLINNKQIELELNGFTSIQNHFSYK